MDIRFQNLSGAGWQAGCALVFCLEADKPENVAPTLLQYAPWLEISPALRDFSGKKNERAFCYGHPDSPVSRVLLCGLGKKEEVELEQFRQTLAGALSLCRGKNIETLLIPEENSARLAPVLGCTPESLLSEACTAALLGLYVCRSFKGQKQDKQEQKQDPRWLAFAFSTEETPDLFQRAVRCGEAEAIGVRYARDLGNSPGNILPPEALAARAEALAKQHSFRCTLFEAEEIKRQGMGALLAVGRGSAQEPRFIILEHCPPGLENDPPLILIGKGITFDSGGISLKPAAKMHEMKGDMGGAAAILGFFSALGQSPDRNEFPRIIGLVPAAENMPGGRASRPGDIITSLSGKTVEILNTDAEGRLILCDALSFAQREWQPKAVIDLATLTGACVIALGDLGAGLFTKNRALRKLLLDAAAKVGDLCWPLPLWKEYDPNLDSDFADLANIGPREGGAVHAALFLQRFVEKTTVWAHLDIAGPAYVTQKTALHPVPGASGMGVRLLYEAARQFAGLPHPLD